MLYGTAVQTMIGIKVTGLDELRRQMSTADFKSAIRVAALGIAAKDGNVSGK